jgi:hypothetical protein
MHRIGGGKEAQIDADNAISPLAHDQGSDRAIDAAAHGDYSQAAASIVPADFVLGQEILDIEFRFSLAILVCALVHGDPQ